VTIPSVGEIPSHAICSLVRLPILASTIQNRHGERPLIPDEKPETLASKVLVMEKEPNLSTTLAVRDAGTYKPVDHVTHGGQIKAMRGKGRRGALYHLLSWREFYVSWNVLEERLAASSSHTE